MSEAELLAKALETLLPSIAGKLKLKAAAELRRLQAENDALRQQIQENASDALTYEFRIERRDNENYALQCEVEALRADAERYRWLRDGKNDWWNNGIVQLHYDDFSHASEEELDAAIDAARKA